jgi:hypothetical protein
MQIYIYETAAGAGSRELYKKKIQLKARTSSTLGTRELNLKRAGGDNRDVEH